MGYRGSDTDNTQRKRAEEQARASEANFRALFAAMQDMVIVGDQAGRVFFINDALTQKLGYTLEDLDAIGILGLHPADKQREAREIFAAMFQGERSSCPLPLQSKDGRLIPVETRVSFGQWSGQEAVFGIIKDLTDQVDASVRLSLATQAGGVGVWDLDLINNRLVWDDQMFALYGLSRESFGGAYASWKAGVHPDDLPRCEREVAAALEHGQPFDSEFRVVWPDGSVHDIRALATVILDAAGQPTHMIGTNWDITERKRTEERLRQRTRDLEDIRQTLTDQSALLVDAMGAGAMGAWYFDVAAGMFSFTDCLYALFRTTAAVEGGSLMSPSQYAERFIPPAERALVATELQAALTSEVRDYRRMLDHPVIFADGEPGWIQVSFRLERDEQGKPLRIVGMNQDITARKEAEQRLRDINRELEEATARANAMAVQAEQASIAKSEFLANMSHEIRTPMNGVIGMTSLLLDTDLSPEQRRYAETVRASGEALLALINDILDFSKIEAGKLDLETLDVDLQALLDDCTASLAFQARQKGLELLCDLPPDIPHLLRGDPGRLRQVLANLAGNAIKFTPSGEVAIRVTLVSETAERALVRFAIADTGIGIAPDKQRLLFQKFTQVDASTTRQYGGTGLGLAICKQLVELMGGDIGLQSAPARGSEFWFQIPLLKQTGQTGQTSQTATRPARWAAPGFTGLGKRVLLAEDHIVNQQLALAMLKKLGLHADAVANGREALEALRTTPYDLVLMDVQMPELDGLEATRQIRDPNTQVLDHQIPIIAMTANAMVGDREVCLAAGMNGYVSKPIHPQALAAELAVSLKLFPPYDQQ